MNQKIKNVLINNKKYLYLTRDSLFIGIVSIIFLGLFLAVNKPQLIYSSSESKSKGFDPASSKVTLPSSPTLPAEREYLQVTVSNGNLNIDYKNYGISLSPVFVMQNGAQYGWQDIPSTIQKDLWKEKIDDNTYKYGVTFSNISTTTKNNLKFVSLHRADVRNLVLDDFEIRGSMIVIKNKIILSHEDILANYTIPVINKTDIVIGNLTDNFVSNGDGTWNITFDPTISIQASYYSDAYLVNVTSEPRNVTHLSINSTSPYDSLVGYWNFDHDIDLNNYHVNGIVGQAQYFDSVDDSVYVSGSTNLTGKNITITGWINLPTVDTKGVILKGWNAVGGYGLRLGSTGQIVASLSNMTAYREYVSPNAVTANTWIMVTMTYDVDNNNLTIYKNATPIYSTNPVGATRADSTAIWAIGRRGDAAWYIKGTMDEFKVYSRLLNSTELTTMYNEEYSGSPTTVSNTGLILYLPFNDTNGTIARDYANNIDGYSMGYTRAIDYARDADGTYNVVTWNIENGVIGSGVNFDKSTGGVNIGTQSQFSNLCNSTSGLSISAWIKPLDAGENSEGGIIGKVGEPSTSNGRWVLRLASNRLSFQKGYSGAVLSKSTATTTPLKYGIWQHVAMTWNCSVNMYDDNVLKFYINGSETEYLTRINGSGTYNDDRSLAIGLVPDANRVFNGTMDEVMIFNNTLTAQQIQNIYNNQSARFMPQGTQDNHQFNITSGNNRANVSINTIGAYINSSVQLRLGEWDINKDYNLSDDGLVIYYNFDNRSDLGETATKVRDRMNNINGTISGGATYQNGSGEYYGSYLFDGSNDYVNINNDAKIQASSFTVSLWVKPAFLFNSSTKQTIPLVTKWYTTMSNGFALMYLNSTNEDGQPAGLTMFFYTGDYYSANTKQNLTADIWHNVIGVYNSTSGVAYIYIDGNIAGDSTAGGTFSFTPNTDLDMQIGRDTERAYTTFKGNVDEFMYYNRSLGSDEIKRLYVKGRANWAYRDYQSITTTSNYTYTINSSTTNIQSSFKQLAGLNNFYSPTLGGYTNYDLYNVTEAPAQQGLQINFTNPTPGTSTQTGDSIYVNITSSSSDDHYVFNDFDSSLVFWMRFDNMNSTNGTTDLSRFANNGTMQGSTAINSSGRFGNASWYEGTDSYIDISATNYGNLSKFTNAMWIYPFSSGSEPVMIKAGDHAFQIPGTTDLRYYNGTTTLDASGVIQANRWQFVAVTTNGTMMFMYVNSTNVANFTFSNSQPPIDYIGFYSGATHYFYGGIDEMMIFNRTFTDNEIKALYNASAYKYERNFTSLLNGAHTIKGYAVDTTGRRNETETRTITISAGGGDTTKPYFTSIPNNLSILFMQNIGVDFNATDETAFDSYSINRTADFSINSTGWLRNTTVLSVGIYYINVTINDTSNNVNSTIYKIEINKTYPLLTLSVTSPISYGQTSDFAGSESNVYDGGCTYSLNITNQIFGAGTIWANYSTSGCQNYTANSTVKSLTINKNNTFVLSVTKTTPISYGQTTDFSGIGCPSQLTCSLNISNGAYGAGVIWTNYSTPGNVNYSANSVLSSITINPNNTYVLSLSRTSPIEYGRATDFSGGGCPSQLSCSLNITNQVYGAGTIFANYSTPGNVNYSANSVINSAVINKNNSFALTLSRTSPIEYGQATDFSGSGCPSQLTCSLNISNQVYGAGTIFANYSTPGNVNYSAGSVVNSVVINKNNTYVLTLSRTSPITYGTVTDFAGSGCPSQLSCTLNISNAIYGVGTVFANYSSNGNVNYSANSVISSTVINQAASQTSLIFDKTSPQIYGTAITPTCSVLIGQGTPTLTNGTSGVAEVLGVGTWNFNCSLAASQNYTASSNFSQFIITQYTQSITPLLNGVNSNLIVTFPQQINASFSGTNYTIATISINGSIVNKGQNYTWGVGGWVVNWTLASNQNYSGFQTYLNMTISQGTGSISLLLNGTSGNLSLVYPSDVNASARTTTGQTVSLLRNGTDVTSQNHVYQDLMVAYYNFTACAAENQNYSRSCMQRFVTYTKADSQVFTYINQSRANKNYVNGTQVPLNGSLDIGQFGSINLTINGTQLNYSTSRNVSILYLFNDTGTFWINTTYSGNENYTSAYEAWRVIISAPSSGTSNATIISVSTCKYKKLGYYNLKLPWFKEVGCI